MAGTLAIDLGSTTTVVAYQPAGGPAELLELAPYACGSPAVVPSLLWLAQADSGQPLIGRQVLEAGLAEHPGPELHRDFKRHIGQGDAGDPAANATASLLTPEQAAELLLQRLWRQLPAELTPSRLVLTAPIDAYRGYRRWLTAVTASLAVPEIALVDEPTAAAIGAGLAPGSRVLVVDLGGGTIDLSLVALEGGEGRAAPIAQLLRFGGRDLEGSRQTLRTARVLGKAGLALGGRDIDHWIAADLCPDQPSSASLLAAAERLKCALSDEPEALTLWTPAPGAAPRPLRLDRAGLAGLLERRGLIAALDQLLETVLGAARAAGIGLTDLDAVLPVGGTSRLPAVQAWLQERCPGVPLRGERPIEAVALGALALTPGVAVKDVLSCGVSLRCWDQRSGRHRWHPLFVPGQAWPTERPLELVLAASRDGQRELELVLGEPRAEERSEVVFVGGLPVLRQRPAGEAAVEAWPRQPQALPLEPAASAGVDRLRLRFRIDAEGQLQLQAEDLLSATALPERSLGSVR